MASSKEASSGQQRLSLGSAASSLPARHAHSRTHSHSITVGPTNNGYRVTRRKSMSSTAANNVAAMAAAVKASNGGAGVGVGDLGTSSSRRSAMSRAALSSKGSHSNGFPSPSSSLPRNAAEPGQPGFTSAASKNGTAVVDGPPLAVMSENGKSGGKARVRRASEGSRLVKGDGKRMSGGELKCEKCGKGYKHSSCLTKHLWEHTPEWALTSKLLISKHQQVQLLEAASVLVAMNQETSEQADNVKKAESDESSTSPAASGSSEMQEDYLSSTNTTPPPHAEESVNNPSSNFNPKRYSNTSSVYSRSYQSTSATSAGMSESAPNGQAYLSHFRQWSADHKSPTSASIAGSYYDDEEQADLAAAVGLLSCSYGTPKSGPVILPHDVPPVPPLPAKFLGQINGPSGSTVGQPSRQYRPTSYGYDTSAADESVDVQMDYEPDNIAIDDELDRPLNARGRTEEDDDGVFGTMEE